jgi:regulator of replication initiation timing
MSDNQILQFLNSLNTRVVRIEADNASLRNENASVRNENASLRNQLASQGGLSARATPARPAVPQSPGAFSVRTFQEQLDALDESSDEDGEANDAQMPVSDSCTRCFRAPYPRF